MFKKRAKLVPSKPDFFYLYKIQNLPTLKYTPLLCYNVKQLVYQHQKLKKNKQLNLA